MVTAARCALVTWLCLAAACGFDTKKFGDRHCNSDQDCPRPDEACLLETCTQRSCQLAADCGPAFEFACTAGQCVVQSCSAPADCALGYACVTGFCQASFNVASAASASNDSITVTFDAPPNPAQATRLANYAISGLTVTGTPSLSGNTVTIATSPQAATSYTVTVSGVTRASDGAALTIATANFTGRTGFNVASAASASSGSVMVTFDAPPDPATATTLANYAIPGLTLSGTPMLFGSTVTLVTSPQTATSYTVTVSGVARASDAEPLTITTASFAGHTRFNVASAASASSGSITVTFDAPPNAAQATTLANYAVAGLTLSGAPALNGNTVTITTSVQAATTYTVTVSGVTRASDGEPLTVATANFTGRSPFDVASAASASSGSITVTFDAAPNAAQATTLANYAVPGLTLGGTPTLSGNTVTIATSPQSATSYTVTVSGVSRASDGEPLTVASASFTGRPPFDVTGAASASSHSMTVTFDAAPNAAQATTLANYAIPGLTLSGTPTLSGNTVTIATSPQSATTYTVTVSAVTRAADGEPLTVASASFTGRAPFDVAGAAATSSHSMTVTFDAPPNAAQATTLANYAVAGLTLSGAPALSGNTVTITTSVQAATTYTVTVSGVTRASDGEPLTITTANFSGRTPFDVASAASATSGSITVTFDAPPNAAQATTLANYAVPGLTLGGTPTLSGNTVTIATSPQAGTSYTVTVSAVTRASDGEPLTVASASFTGRTPFDVTGAAATSSHSMTVTFDAPPNAAQATTLANYAIPGLTLSGTPTLAGNTVTIATSPQSATTFTVTVTGVTRSSDAEPLTVKTASFTGRAPFDVSGAASTTSHSMTVTFDAPPNAAQATTLANYAVAGLTLSGAPSLSGNTVTITTSAQAATTYGVIVSNVTRASDGEPLTVASASFTGRPPFDVSGAAAASGVSITVTFDAAPNAAQATTLANYSVPGLTLSGTPSLSGSTVTITTASQLVTSYTVTVSGVTRASDGEPLTVASASFTGRSGFNVSSAASLSRVAMTVTFDAPPNVTQATTLANYSVPGLTLSGTPTLSGNTVTITTSTQAATTYTVTVSGVTRASDGEPLTIASASFTGRPPFDVSGAASASSSSITVTFDAAPNTTQATALANYAVGGLILSGTPVLSGSVVTLTTSAQLATNYTVTVTGVTRASDGEPLTISTASFSGTPLGNPTVTDVVVQSTSPNNGATFYNTGTATVVITGTNFVNVTCPSGVALDDLDGVGNVVATRPTSCTVDSTTQITATFPAGIRTNGAFGWDVRVTNSTGTNATSTVRLVPLAGLLISEVYTGLGGATTQEFLELYNPTTTTIDVTAIGLAVHIRSGTGTDANKALTFINTVVPSHGFLLIISIESATTDAWYAHRDVTYSAATSDLTGNGGVYVSLSTTANVTVLDKAGWGSQPIGGYEGTAMPDIKANNSAQRKPAGGAGDATDTDNNSADFNPPSTSITPEGTVDPPQP